MRTWARHRASGLLVAGILLVSWAGPAGAQRPREVLPFPDVPPWHWAYQAVLRAQKAGIFVGYPTTPSELVENSIVQVLAGFAHGSAPGAQAWVERFTFDRGTTWPAPLEHSSLVGFTLTAARIAVRGDTASASLTATLRTRTGRVLTVPLRLALRYNGQDWQVDYGTLARASALFR